MSNGVEPGKWRHSRGYQGILTTSFPAANSAGSTRVAAEMEMMALQNPSFYYKQSASSAYEVEAFRQPLAEGFCLFNDNTFKL